MNTEQILFFILCLWVALAGLGLAFDAAGALYKARAAYVEARARRGRSRQQEPPVRDAGHFPPQAKEWTR